MAWVGWDRKGHEYGRNKVANSDQVSGTQEQVCNVCACEIQPSAPNCSPIFGMVVAIFMVMLSLQFRYPKVNPWQGWGIKYSNVFVRHGSTQMMMRLHMFAFLGD